MDGTVRRANVTDLPALERLRHAWTNERRVGAVDADFSEQFSSWARDEWDRRHFWLAERAGQPIGMVNLLTVERMPRPGAMAGRWGYLGNLFVVPEARRAGIATLLVDAVLHEARARRMERVLVHPNEASLDFWRSSSFVGPADLLVHDLA